MLGRAKRLYDDFRMSCGGPAGRFVVARMILLARVLPEELTPTLDSPEIEARLEKAIKTLRATTASTPREDVILETHDTPYTHL